MLFAKALVGVAMTAQTAFSIGVSLTQFNGQEQGTGNCDENTFIEPIWNILPFTDTTQCNVFSSSPAGSYYRVDTFNTADNDFSCQDGQDIFLKIWQSSDACGNIPDASVGPLSTTPQKGGCIQGRVRSARFSCGL